MRVGHGIIVFPGGVGTAEEILYLLGVLLHPDNTDTPMPMIMTGPASAAAYFKQIDEFVGATLGAEAQNRYEIVIDDPERAAVKIDRALDEVRAFRKQHGDAYYFNWRLTIDRDFQQPFKATHESMQAIDLAEDLPTHILAANLRRVFSGIVSGNVHEDTLSLIEANGPFEINGSARLMGLLDELLASFVKQKRMKLAAADYVPCYRVVGQDKVD